MPWQFNFDWHVKAGRGFADYHRLLAPGDGYEGMSYVDMLRSGLNSYLFGQDIKSLKSSK